MSGMSLSSSSTSMISTNQDDAIGPPSPDRWLNAHYDPLATLYTFSSCMAMSDLNGDGDHKLIIADLGTGSYNMKLKVYKGTTLLTENTLTDLPTGVVTFHMDLCEPRIPAIAVASGSHIYIYKNLRPYFKFSLPGLEINSLERDLWTQAQDDSMDVGILYEMLQNLRHDIGDSKLTARSQRLLMLSDEQDLKAFVDIHKNFPLKRMTVVTCIETMKKSHAEDDAVSCLVLGTESCSIYVLDPEAFTILDNMSMESVPVYIAVSGLYDVEYRIVAACRNGHICTLRRGWKAAKKIIELDSQPVGLLRKEKNIIVGTMDETVQCYSNKGKKLWSLKLANSICAMEILDLRQIGLQLIVLSLSNSSLRIYRDKHLVDCFHTEDVVTAMKFGRFGREDNSLVMGTRGGGLMVKILKRTAKFESQDLSIRPTASQNLKLNVPKKTKMFVDQTMRERENSVLMHRVFQHDLYRLRLNTARSYVQALEKCMNPVSSDPSEPLKLSAQVLGLGPAFKLHITLQNASAKQPSQDLAITFYCDDKLYNIEKPYIAVPMLVPGLVYHFETQVECISDLGISDYVRVFVVKTTQTQPLLTAIINMPVSEMVLMM